MKVEWDFFRGMAILGLVPLMCVLGAILLPYAMYHLGIPTPPQYAWFTFALFFTLYCVGLLQHVVYDYRKIRRIEIPAPKRIEDLLKTTTNRGVLLNIELISAFENDYSLSQTDLVNYIAEKGIQLTDKRIRDYIMRLEKNNIIHSPAMAEWKKEYTLTETGEWCRNCIKKLFPKRYFWYVYRHYLGCKKLPRFPAKSQKTK